jgi:hypothetical protein
MTAIEESMTLRGYSVASNETSLGLMAQRVLRAESL